MKQDDFQDKVIGFLGEQKVEHKEISRRLREVEAQAKITNGSVAELKIWKSNLNGKITILTGVFSLIMTIAWQFLKDRFTK